MGHYLNLFMTSIIFLSGMTLSASAMDVSEEDRCAETKRRLFKEIYDETQFNISAEQFEQYPINKKIIYLGALSNDFQNGLTQKTVTDYVTFFRIMFPHLKTSTKVWEDLTKRFGDDKKNTAVITQLRYHMNTAKKTFEEIEQYSSKAYEIQQKGLEAQDASEKNQKYKSALFMWNLIYDDTNHNNDRRYQELNMTALSKKLELLRLVRVSQRTLR